MSTLDDYMKFARMLRNGGKTGTHEILKPETLRYMCSGQLLPVGQQDFDQWIGLDGFSYGNLMLCLQKSVTGCYVCQGR